MQHVINVTTLALALFAHSLFAATSPVGATPGSFAVSPSGAATYSIPIQIPPGVGGMQPGLALSYNSQGGNGIAGVGWGIAGLSAITRCGATIDRDGVKGGVNLTYDDRFCLDGQRLILVSGTYGYAFSEYRTEIESFNKIVATGPRSGTTSGNGPRSFIVTSKNGVTTEYGDGNGASQFAQGKGTVLNWHVSTIKDAVGNSMQFFYTTDSLTTGEHRIDHIDYTYFGTAFVGGVARSVKFNYGARGVNPDVETSYVGGGAVKTSQRLTSVQTSVGASSVRSYNLGYDNSAATGRSRVTSVQECSGDGACLGPTVFSYPASASLQFSQKLDPITATAINGSGQLHVGDWNGDGISDVMYYYAAGGNNRWFVNTGINVDRPISVKNGLNAQTTLTYKPLTDASVYTKDPDSSVAYPVKNVQDPMYVVSAVASSNGLGGFNTASYSYTGMKEHQTGRGNLGFRTMTVTGPDGITSVTTNNQNFPYVCMPTQVNVYKPGVDLRNPLTLNSYLLSSTTNTFKCLSGTGTALNPSTSPTPCAPPAYSATASYGNTLYLPYVSSSTSSSWDLDGTALPTSTSTVNSLDAYGNTLSATATSSDGYSKTSATYYNNDTANWRLGWVVASQVSSTVPLAYSNTGAAQTQTRTTLNNYDTLGRLIRTVVEPETGSYTLSTGVYNEPATATAPYFTLITEYGYDPTYGYQNSVKVRGKDVLTRETKTALDFVANTVTTTNALLHSEVQTLDPKFGVPLTSKGPNGLVTTWTYDGFGRKVKELRADLTATTTLLTDHGSAGLYLSADLGSARYSSTTHVLNTSGIDMTPSVTVYYDILGRELRSETQGFNTATIYKDTAYDNLGRVKKASRPYFSSNTVYWTTPAYDALGRTYNVTTPDGAISSTSRSHHHADCADQQRRPYPQAHRRQKQPRPGRESDRCFGWQNLLLLRCVRQPGQSHHHRQRHQDRDHHQHVRYSRTQDRDERSRHGRVVLHLQRVRRIAHAERRQVANRDDDV